MAYSSVRVQFEIGHEASVRTKKTPEGFTHDWEVFVRGADNTDIQCFVDKVVFHLHETFPKPRRVIKEPPYLVKESGYAGFVLPIDVYLKNKEEPKKISFQYDLQLQPSGPPISRVLREPRLFQNPSEDFRRKLIRGGGVGVDTPSDSHHADDLKGLAPPLKGKATDSPLKKHRPDSLNTNDSFAELFGTPIRRVLDPKKATDAGKKLPDSDLLKNKKKINKYDSFKDEKESAKEKDKGPEKERPKEREKNRDKQNRRPPSPSMVSLLQNLKSKDDHKRHDDKRKDDHDEKKRKKEDRDKREKVKETKEVAKQTQEKDHKKEKKDLKDLDLTKKPHLTKSFEGKGNYEKHASEFSEKEKHKHRHKKKEKDKNKDREKQKKRDSKDDRLEKEPKEREREKSTKKKHDESRERDEKSRRKSKSPSPAPDRLKKKPLNALLDELGSSDSMSPLSDEETTHPFRSLSKPLSKPLAGFKSLAPVTPLSTKTSSTNFNAPDPVPKAQEKDFESAAKTADNDSSKGKKDKSWTKKTKKPKEEPDKRKGHPPEERRPRSPSTEVEDDEDEDGDEDAVKSRNAPKEPRERLEKERLEEEKSRSNKDKENKKRKRDRSPEKQPKTKKSANFDNSRPPSTTPAPGLVDFPLSGEDGKTSERFTKEYVAQLKDLQQRIMSLEDNAELQKVVKVIAETGQYEITKKTFDFDLCALDFDTVKRLQDFFLPT